MLGKLLVLGLGLGLVGCGAATTQPAKSQSGAAATVRTQKSAAPEPIPPERVAELIAALESGRAKAGDYRNVTPAVANAAVPGLIAALKNDNPSVRREAIKVLHKYMVTGPPERKAAMAALKSAEPALILALKDQDAGVRKAAIEALMSAPATKGQASVFIESLQDADRLVRMRAAAALGHIGPAAKEAVPALAAAMADSDEFVSGSATNALVRIGLPAVPALVKELRH